MCLPACHCDAKGIRMTADAVISMRRWQMGRARFAVHVVAIAVCVASFTLTNSGTPWLIALALILALPLSQSMRLNRLGHSPYWPILPLLGALILVWQLMSGLAAVSGAPSGQPDPSEQAAFAAGMTGLAIMALITLICLAPERWIRRNQDRLTE